MLITVQQNPSWQLSLAQLSPSLLHLFSNHTSSQAELFCVNLTLTSSSGRYFTPQTLQDFTPQTLKHFTPQTL